MQLKRTTDTQLFSGTLSVSETGRALVRAVLPPSGFAKEGWRGRIGQKNSCFMRQEVENLKAFNLKLGLGIIWGLQIFIRIVFSVITGQRRDSAMHENVLSMVVTGKPPESSVCGFVGFEYEFLPWITHSSSCTGQAVWDTDAPAKVRRGGKAQHATWFPAFSARLGVWKPVSPSTGIQVPE